MDFFVDSKEYVIGKIGSNCLDRLLFNNIYN